MVYNFDTMKNKYFRYLYFDSILQDFSVLSIVS